MTYGNIKRNRKLVDCIVSCLQKTLKKSGQWRSSYYKVDSNIPLRILGISVETPVWANYKSKEFITVFEEGNKIYIGISLNTLYVPSSNLKDLDLFLRWQNSLLYKYKDVLDWASGSKSWSSVMNSVFKDFYVSEYNKYKDTYHKFSDDDLKKTDWYIRADSSYRDFQSSVKFKLKDEEFKGIKSRRDVFPLLTFECDTGKISYFKGYSYSSSSGRDYQYLNLGRISSKDDTLWDVCRTACMIGINLRLVDAYGYKGENTPDTADLVVCL